jgi:hypothetical protein
VPPENGIGPLIQQRRMPFFNRTVVMVAVVIFSSVAMSSGDRAASGEKQGATLREPFGPG